MAFLRRAVPESVEGRWKEMGTDPDNGLMVACLIRPCPDEKVQELRQKYGYEKEVATPYETKDGRKGTAFQLQRVMSNEDYRSHQRDIAVWSWLDTRNMTIRANDAETAELLTRLCRANGLTFPVGEDVLVDGRLTDQLKHNLCQHDGPLARAIADDAIEQAETAYGRGQKLRGNS